MTSKSPWGTIGAWAAEAERADEEEKQLAAELAADKPPPPPLSFPSLKESVTSSTKQKKKTKMSLHEFNNNTSSSSSSFSTRLTPDEIMRLPTRPQDRSPDELNHGRLGGGFSNYGTRSGGSGPGGMGRVGNYGESDGRRRYGGFGEMGGGMTSPRVSEFEQMTSSRADEVDNWSSMKRPQQVSSRPTRYADLGGGGVGGGGGGFSRADEVDNWASMKKPQAVMQSGQVSSRSSFGSGFRNEMRPVGGDSERWTRNNDQESTLGVEMPVIVVKENKPNPFGEARPREEVLTEKGVDWKKLDEEIEVKKVGGISRPNSSQSQSSRPGSAQSVRSDGGVLQKGQLEEGGVEGMALKMKPKVNPFGEAKPREVLLAEKGVDWRKIDLELEHKRIDRPETDEEKNLKEEIESLKKYSLQKSGEEQSNLHDEIIKKEKDLELLIQELDNKVRFGQKNIDRPGSGSGSGRYSGPPARLSSFPGPSEEPRGAAEFTDRPSSRGTVESWPRQNDDRRSFSGGRGGFLGNREHDRSVARNRW